MMTRGEAVHAVRQAIQGTYFRVKEGWQWSDNDQRQADELVAALAALGAVRLEVDGPPKASPMSERPPGLERLSLEDANLLRGILNGSCVGVEQHGMARLRSILTQLGISG